MMQEVSENFEVSVNVLNVFVSDETAGKKLPNTDKLGVASNLKFHFILQYLMSCFSISECDIFASILHLPRTHHPSLSHISSGWRGAIPSRKTYTGMTILGLVMFVCSLMSTVKKTKNMYVVMKQECRGCPTEHSKLRVHKFSLCCGCQNDFVHDSLTFNTSTGTGEHHLFILNGVIACKGTFLALR